MKPNEYQVLARSTRAVCNNKNEELAVLTLGLVGESAEFSECVYQSRHNYDVLVPVVKLRSEAGDCLWYVSQILDVLGFELGRFYEDMQGRYDGFTTLGTPEEFSTRMLREAGKLGDAVKKVVGHGHPLDTDVLYDHLCRYQRWLSASVEALGVETLGEIAEENIAKLRRRYPAGFDSERSINREPEGAISE